MTTQRSRILRTLIAAFATLSVVAIASSAAEKFITSTLATDGEWAALKWSPEEVEMFAGSPQRRGDKTGRVVVRYSYFVSEYDTRISNPLWVAHINTAQSAAAGKTRTGEAWDRKHTPFRPDQNIIAFSQARKIFWVTDSDYTKANVDPWLPIDDFNRLTRGHLASNLEMKGHGDDQEGMRSQAESFSFANVVPQLQQHNSPMWAALEQDCLMLATKLGRVAVISGPVFQVGGQSIRLTKGQGKVRIPIPTHMFKVIVATVDGKTAAAAFLIPHQLNISKDQRMDYVVSVRDVERRTGINFMPGHGRNDVIEMKPAQELLRHFSRN